METTAAQVLAHQRRATHDDLGDVGHVGRQVDQPLPASSDRAALSQHLLSRAAAEPDPVERKRLQDEVVVLHMGLARAIAARYRGRGIAEEDLRQAAAVALLKAARGFDTSRGEFLPYAIVTMKGEVKRQFRDYGWMVRPPRPIQKLQGDVSRAQGELIQLLGRSPRVAEVAEHLGVPEEAVLEALSADGCYTPASLDCAVGPDGGAALGELLPDEGTAVSEAEARVMLAPAVRGLPQRDRRILYLRFFRQQTQAQIADDVGLTQMQVSRILSRVLTQLRGRLG
jgi:RNA polymerase sigma-B factor